MSRPHQQHVECRTLKHVNSSRQLARVRLVTSAVQHGAFNIWHVAGVDGPLELGLGFKVGVKVRIIIDPGKCPSGKVTFRESSVNLIFWLGISNVMLAVFVTKLSWFYLAGTLATRIIVSSGRTQEYITITVVIRTLESQKQKPPIRTPSDNLAILAVDRLLFLSHQKTIPIFSYISKKPFCGASTWDNIITANGSCGRISCTPATAKPAPRPPRLFNLSVRFRIHTHLVFRVRVRFRVCLV